MGVRERVDSGLSLSRMVHSEMQASYLLTSVEQDSNDIEIKRGVGTRLSYVMLSANLNPNKLPGRSRADVRVADSSRRMIMAVGLRAEQSHIGV